MDGENRKIPGERLVSRVLSRTRRRPRMGLSPDFYARFGMEDPWSAPEIGGEPTDGGDGFVYLSAAPYYQMMRRLAAARKRRERRLARFAERHGTPKVRAVARQWPGESAASLVTSRLARLTLDDMTLPPQLPAPTPVVAAEETSSPEVARTGRRGSTTRTNRGTNAWWTTPWVPAKVFSGGAPRGERPTERAGARLVAASTASGKVARALEEAAPSATVGARRKALARVAEIVETLPPEQQEIEIRRIVRRIGAASPIVRTVYEDAPVTRPTEIAARRASPSAPAGLRTVLSSSPAMALASAPELDRAATGTLATAERSEPNRSTVARPRRVTATARAAARSQASPPGPSAVPAPLAYARAVAAAALSASPVSAPRAVEGPAAEAPVARAIVRSSARAVARGAAAPVAFEAPTPTATVFAARTSAARSSSGVFVAAASLPVDPDAPVAARSAATSWAADRAEPPAPTRSLVPRAVQSVADAVLPTPLAPLAPAPSVSAALSASPVARPVRVAGAPVVPAASSPVRAPSGAWVPARTLPAELGGAAPATRYVASATFRTPDSTFVGARTARTPDGEWTGARTARTPDGEWTGARTARTPDGEWTGARTARTPDGEWTGARTSRTPDGTFVGARTARTPDGEWTGARTSRTPDGEWTGARTFRTPDGEHKTVPSRRTLPTSDLATATPFVAEPAAAATEAATSRPRRAESPWVGRAASVAHAATRAPTQGRPAAERGLASPRLEADFDRGFPTFAPSVARVGRLGDLAGSSPSFERGTQPARRAIRVAPDGTWLAPTEAPVSPAETAARRAEHAPVRLGLALRALEENTSVARFARVASTARVFRGGPMSFALPATAAVEPGMAPAAETAPGARRSARAVPAWRVPTASVSAATPVVSPTGVYTTVQAIARMPGVRILRTEAGRLVAFVDAPAPSGAPAVAPTPGATRAPVTGRLAASASATLARPTSTPVEEIDASVAPAPGVRRRATDWAADRTHVGEAPAYRGAYRTPEAAFVGAQTFTTPEGEFEGARVSRTPARRDRPRRISASAGEMSLPTPIAAAPGEEIAPTAAPSRTRRPLTERLPGVANGQVEPGAPTWAARSDGTPMVRSPGGLFEALARANTTEDIVRVLYARAEGVRDIPLANEAPVVQVIEQIRQEVRREVVAGPSEAAPRAPRMDVPGATVIRGQYVQPVASTARVRRGGVRPVNATARTLQSGAGDDRIMKLVKKLQGLIHLAEAEGRLLDAQRQVRMAEDSPGARAEGQGPVGAVKDTGEKREKQDIEALSREVLEHVTRELEHRRSRRVEDHDESVWW